MPFTLNAPAPSSALQEVAFAIEATPGGTPGTNFYVLPEIGFDNINDMLNGKPFTKPGNLFPTAMQVGKRWATGAWSGIAGYNTMLFVGRSCLNKGVKTTPTRSNTYTWLQTASGGNNVFSFGGVASANVSDSASAAAIQTALNAISTVGPGAFTVKATGVANTFTITVAPFYDFGGALTKTSGPGTLTNAAASADVVDRWRIVVSPNRRSDIQTLFVKKGMVDTAGESISAPYGFFTGLQLNFSPTEATMSGGFVCGSTTPEQTLAASELKFLPTNPVNMNSFQIAIGLAKSQAGGAFAIEKLCDISNVSISMTDKEKPFVNIGCDDAGYQTHITMAPNSSLTLGVLANVNGRLIRSWVLEARPIYLCIYSKGTQIEGNYYTQMRIVTPIYLTDLPSNNQEGAYTFQFAGNVASANGDTFELIVDTMGASAPGLPPGDTGVIGGA